MIPRWPFAIIAFTACGAPMIRFFLKYRKGDGQDYLRAFRNDRFAWIIGIAVGLLIVAMSSVDASGSVVGSIATALPPALIFGFVVGVAVASLRRYRNTRTHSVR